MALKTDAMLTSDLATVYPDNSSGDISEADLRSQQTDVIDSKLNISAASINGLTEDLPPIDTASDVAVQRDNGDYRRIKITNWPVDHTAVNYTASSEILGDHFAGVDTKLGTIGTEIASASVGAVVYENASGDHVGARPPAGFDISIPGAVVAQTIKARAPIGETYSTLEVEVSAGSFTMTVSIDGTAITGASAITVNQTTRASINLTNNNVATEGEIITIAISSPSLVPAPADFHMSLIGDVTAIPA